MIVATPGGVRSASGSIATCWAPIGQFGAMQRKRSESASTTPSQSLPSTR